MFPPVFQIASQDNTVKSLLGAGTPNNPVRLYPFGLAPQESNRVYPYATWQTIYGSPENFLAGRPIEDGFSAQIDIYAKTAAAVRVIATALNDALELDGYVTRFGNEDVNPDTKTYHYSFDIDFIVKRQ